MAMRRILAGELKFLRLEVESLNRGAVYLKEKIVELRKLPENSPVWKSIPEHITRGMKSADLHLLLAAVHNVAKLRPTMCHFMSFNIPNLFAVLEGLSERHQALKTKLMFFKIKLRTLCESSLLEEFAEVEFLFATAEMLSGYVKFNLEAIEKEWNDYAHSYRYSGSEVKRFVPEAYDMSLLVSLYNDPRVVRSAGSSSRISPKYV